jgi:hypothetical protein
MVSQSTAPQPWHGALRTRYHFNRAPAHFVQPTLLETLTEICPTGGAIDDDRAVLARRPAWGDVIPRCLASHGQRQEAEDVLVLSYLDGALDPNERRAFETHIADCRNCWRFLRSYRETVSLGRQLRDEDIPPDVRDRLETFLRNRLHRPSG